VFELDPCQENLITVTLVSLAAFPQSLFVFRFLSFITVQGLTCFAYWQMSNIPMQHRSLITISNLAGALSASGQLNLTGTSSALFKAEYCSLAQSSRGEMHADSDVCVCARHVVCVRKRAC